MSKSPKCMEGQINVFELLEEKKESEKSQTTLIGLKGAFQKQKRRVSDADALFRYYAFQRAYDILKLQGKIHRPDILEFEYRVSNEVYESVYCKALIAVYHYCRDETKDIATKKKLSKEYAKEFDRMAKRLQAREERCG